MRRAHLLLLALWLPAGVALAQDADQPQPPPPAEPAPAPEAPAPEAPEAPEAPPIPPAPASPQEKESLPGMETLISGTTSSGGYGGPVLVYSRVMDRDAFFFGGRGGWIVNHRFVLGGGGFSMFSPMRAPEGAPDIGEALRFEFGYGGLWLEYIFMPDELLHASIGTLIGGGATSYSLRRRVHREDREVESDPVFVLDPVLAAELNVLRFLRVSVGVGYRHVGSVQLPGLRKDDLSGFTGSLMLKFGRF